MDNSLKLIKAYLERLPQNKSEEMNFLHQQIQALFPAAKLWFLDGKNEEGKVVANPNIGYGKTQLSYKDGTKKDFYQVGLSANASGISVYFMGINDKSFLIKKYGHRIGKACVTGYCIKFKSLKDISIEVLLEAILDVFGLR
ncbi:MAG: DUF1801 domain-containing protein [Bacteroidota bacterium]